MNEKLKIQEYIKNYKFVLKEKTHQYMDELKRKRVRCYYYDVGKYNIHYRYIKMNSGAFDIGYNVDYDTNWSDSINIGYEDVYKLMAIIVYEDESLTFEEAILKLVNRVLNIGYEFEEEYNCIHIGKIYPLKFIEGENVQKHSKEINNYKAILEVLKFTLENVEEIPDNILNSMKSVIENQKDILYDVEEKMLAITEYEAEANVIYNVIHEQKEMVEELQTSFQDLLKKHEGD